MKLVLQLILLLFLTQSPGRTQGKESKKKEHPSVWSNTVSLGLHIPFGEFSETHSMGIGMVYGRSDHRFGRLAMTPVRKIGITYEGGIAFYTGKKEKINLVYTYDHPIFVYLHSYAGLIYKPCKNGNIRLVAGPALGLYDGVARFNLGAHLGFCYFPAKRLGILPGIGLYKEPGSAPLATATFHFQFIF